MENESHRRHRGNDGAALFDFVDRHAGLFSFRIADDHFAILFTAELPGDGAAVRQRDGDVAVAARDDGLRIDEAFEDVLPVLFGSDVLEIRPDVAAFAVGDLVAGTTLSGRVIEEDGLAPHSVTALEGDEVGGERIGHHDGLPLRLHCGDVGANVRISGEGLEFGGLVNVELQGGLNFSSFEIGEEGLHFREASGDGEGADCLLLHGDGVLARETAFDLR